ncbi:MAG TPA: FadR family transcriptional regulator [Ruminiclostridium sp.]|jgi:GntR family transcriptional repressor for pyruvate dehydrogenase complex|nr:FadR family transcriptional regulator [Clostridiaceae bacterium]HAA25445.1 FadR family transcriptional regulator [Ruminiclostridium sp.]
MSITAIKQKRVSDEVFEQMKEHIISGEWAPGKKIPSELELVELFGVSRVSVREAIHRLVGMGVLTIRRGEGTYVNEVLPEHYINTLLPILMIESASLSETLEFRAIMEVESARLATRNADEQDIARMEKAIKVMEKNKGNNREFAAADLNFHVAIAMATHNSVIIKVNAIIHDMLKKIMEEIVDITGYEGGLYYHRRILEAIKNRDENAAVKTMREHISATMDKTTGLNGQKS